MTPGRMVVYILIAVGMTLLTRSLPFLIFRNGRSIPQFVLWMGRQLPGAAMAMLVVYCLKDVRFGSGKEWIPALAACLMTVLLHVRRRNMMISIVGGTMLYMLLLRLI